MARLIPVCGRPRHISPHTPPHFTLEELQELVRTNAPVSYIERVPGFRMGSVEMLCHEEGRIYNLPINESASILARQPIYGDVLLISSNEWD